MVVDEDELIQLSYPGVNQSIKFRRGAYRKYPKGLFSLANQKLIWPELEGLLDL